MFFNSLQEKLVFIIKKIIKRNKSQEGQKFKYVSYTVLLFKFKSLLLQNNNEIENELQCNNNYN